MLHKVLGTGFAQVVMPLIPKADYDIYKLWKIYDLCFPSLCHAIQHQYRKCLSSICGLTELLKPSTEDTQPYIELLDETS